MGNGLHRLQVEIAMRGKELSMLGAFHYSLLNS